MKRFPLMVASGAIGLALLAGVTHQLAAKNTNAVPPLGACMYYWYTCSYDDGSYWTDCTPGYPAGMIPTSFARIICGSYAGGGNGN